MRQAKQMYTDRVQGFLINKEVYTLVECLEETVDFGQLGVDARETPIANTYIPVENTIMKKPDLTRGADMDFGIQYYDYDKNRDLTKQKFGPLDTLNPLRNHKMARGIALKDRTWQIDNERLPVITTRMRRKGKYNKWRRLSHNANQMVRSGADKWDRMFFSTNNLQDPYQLESARIANVIPMGTFGAVSTPNKLYIPSLNQSPFRQEFPEQYYF